MKLLLDECVVQDFRHLVIGHQVITVGYLGWSGTKNGLLLKRAVDEGFDAIITTDHKIEFEQNLDKLPIAVIVLHAATNDLGDLKPLVAGLLDALIHFRPRTLIHVPMMTNG